MASEDKPPNPSSASSTASGPVDLEPATAAGIGPIADTVRDAAISRPSALSLSNLEAFPNDGPLARRIRAIDHVIGSIEQGVLVTLIAVIVLTAAIVALADKIAGIHLNHKDEIIRNCTFAVALVGAAFASYQDRHLAMDLVSRRLSPRNRLVLRVVLGAVLVFIVAFLVWGGYEFLKTETDTNDEHWIKTQWVAMMIPIGGLLVIVHTVLHAIIDVDYLRRGVTPPDRARSGH